MSKGCLFLGLRDLGLLLFVDLIGSFVVKLDLLILLFYTTLISKSISRVLGLDVGPLCFNLLTLLVVLVLDLVVGLLDLRGCIGPAVVSD